MPSFLVLLLSLVPLPVQSFSSLTDNLGIGVTTTSRPKEPFSIQPSFEIRRSADGGMSMSTSQTQRPRRRSKLRSSSLRSSSRSYHSRREGSKQACSLTLSLHDENGENAPHPPATTTATLQAQKHMSNNNVETIQVPPQSKLSKLSTRTPLLPRKDFLRRIIISSTAIITTQLLPSSKHAAHAIEFVPASPSFSYTYKDAMDIFHAQRRACDNIITVIANGDLNEAGFKLMQVTAQTRMGGKIILEELQSGNGNWNESQKNNKRGTSSKNIFQASDNSITKTKSIITKEDASSNTNLNTNANAMDIAKYLSLQKKFAILMDACDECNIQANNALRGKLGTSAVAQIKLLKVVEGVIYAFDYLLLDLEHATADEQMDVDVDVVI